MTISRVLKIKTVYCITEVKQAAVIVRKSSRKKIGFFMITCGYIVKKTKSSTEIH